MSRGTEQGEMIERAAKWSAHRLLHGSLADELTRPGAQDCPFCGLLIRHRYTYHPPVSREVVSIMYKIALSR